MTRIRKWANEIDISVFILCHSLKWIPNIFELHQSGKEEKDFEWPPWIRE